MSETSLNSPTPDQTTSDGGGFQRPPAAHESGNQTGSYPTGGMMPFPMQMPFVFAPVPHYAQQPSHPMASSAFAIPRMPMMVMAAPAAAYFPPSTNHVAGASHPGGAIQQQPLLYMPVAGQLGAGHQFHQFYGMPGGGCGGYFLVPAASVGRAASSFATSPAMPAKHENLTGTQPSSAQSAERGDGGVALQGIKLEEGLSQERTAITTIGQQPVPISSNESVLAEIEKKLAATDAGPASASPAAEVKSEHVTHLQPTTTAAPTTSTPANSIPQPFFVHAMPYFQPMPSVAVPPHQSIHTNSSVVRLRATAGPRPQTENVCSNCETKETSLWRRSKEGHVECNACNLYHKLNGIPRPPHYKDRGVMKRSRVPPNRGQCPPQPSQATVTIPSPTHQTTEATEEEMQQCAAISTMVKKEALAEQPVVEPTEETKEHDGGGGAVARVVGKKRRGITHHRGLRRKIVVVRKTGKPQER